MDDKAFEQALSNFLNPSGGEIQTITPLFKNTDGTINRERTLELPCYAGFQNG